MSPSKIAQAAYLARWFHRRRHDALKTASRLSLKSRRHGVRRLANGNREHALIRIEMIQIFADAQDAVLAMHVARERAFDGSILQRRSEDLSRRITHACELL